MIRTTNRPCPTDDSTNRQRRVHEVCWAFEESIVRGNSPTIADYVDRVEPDLQDELRMELIAINQEFEQDDTRPRTNQSTLRLGNTKTPTHPRYEFIDEVARGGMGIIWRAHDRHLNREVAIKVLQAQQNCQEMRRRLEQEARIGARLQHPAIVPIYELDQLQDGTPFLCMKLVTGQSLQELLQSDQKPDLPTKRAIFKKVCEAIAFAHGRDIIHRDLKPQNIMIGEHGEIQVMDWGLAKELKLQPGDESVQPLSDSQRNFDANAISGNTLDGMVMGTPAFMSPEQARGEVNQIDRRSDVFALGAILCQLLTGSPAYVGNEVEPLHQQAIRANLEPAHQRLLLSGCPRSLIDLAIECLSESPVHRPANAGVVHKQLNSLQPERRQVSILVGGLLVASLFGFTSLTWNRNGESVGETVDETVAPAIPVSVPASDQPTDSGLPNETSANTGAASTPSGLSTMQYVLTGKRLLQEGELAKAEIMLRQAVSWHPNSNHLRLLLAHSLHREGMEEQEESVLRETIARFPNSTIEPLPFESHFRMQLFELLMKQTRFDEAEAVYAETFALYPNDLIRRLDAAQVLLDHDRQAFADRILSEVASRGGQWLERANQLRDASRDPSLSETAGRFHSRGR